MSKFFISEFDGRNGNIVFKVFVRMKWVQDEFDFWLLNDEITCIHEEMMKIKKAEKIPNLRIRMNH